MKIILGDNQFFGVNHYDLKKGEEVRSKFKTVESIQGFINEALEAGLDGFMMNSNEMGFKVVQTGFFSGEIEVHYSVPYPHKYANMVNEAGMISLLRYVAKNTSLLRNIIGGLKLAITRDLRSVVYQAVDLEIPKFLPTKSYVYLQNIVTDLLVGVGRGDLLVEFIRCVRKLGYRAGLITLNPLMVDKVLNELLTEEELSDLVLCFNINKDGFNTFPSKDAVVTFIGSRPIYKTMGMSIFASGASEIAHSVNFIRSVDLDYVVFGSSSIENIKSNVNLLRSRNLV